MASPIATLEGRGRQKNRETRHERQGNKSDFRRRIAEQIVSLARPTTGHCLYESLCLALEASRHNSCKDTASGCMWAVRTRTRCEHPCSAPVSSVNCNALQLPHHQKTIVCHHRISQEGPYVHRCPDEPGHLRYFALQKPENALSEGFARRERLPRRYLRHVTSIASVAEKREREREREGERPKDPAKAENRRFVVHM